MILTAHLNALLYIQKSSNDQMGMHPDKIRINIIRASMIIKITRIHIFLASRTDADTSAYIPTDQASYTPFNMDYIRSKMSEYTL